MFRTKEFWKNFLKQLLKLYSNSIRSYCTGIFLSLTIFYIFFSPYTSDAQRNALIKILLSAFALPFILSFSLLGVKHFVTMLLPYHTNTFRTSITVLLCVPIISIPMAVFFPMFFFKHDKISIFVYATIIIVVSTPVLFFEYFREKKRMTEYREKLSLYKNHLSDDEKKNNPVKAELFEIQHKTFDKIKQIRTTDPNILKEKLGHSINGKLQENSVFIFAGVEAKHMKKCIKYTFDSEDVNISLSEFKNKKAALSAFDQIPMSYIGIGTEPDGIHIIGEVFWSVKPDVENFSIAAFIFDRYAVCINAKTGFTIRSDCNYGSPEFMCVPENSRKILSSAQKILDILSDMI